MILSVTAPQVHDEQTVEMQKYLINIKPKFVEYCDLTAQIYLGANVQHWCNKQNTCHTKLPTGCIANWPQTMPKLIRHRVVSIHSHPSHSVPPTDKQYIV